MGFLFALIGYLTAVALMVGGAVASALWATRPLPPPREKVVMTDSAKPMDGANVALTKGHGAKKHHVKQHAAKRH